VFFAPLLERPVNRSRDQRLAPHSVDDWRRIINDIFVAQDYTKGRQAAEGLDVRWQRAKRVAQQFRQHYQVVGKRLR